MITLLPLKHLHRIEIFRILLFVILQMPENQTYLNFPEENYSIRISVFF